MGSRTDLTQIGDLSERVALIWSDRVNSAKSVEMFL
jgi:hypothetical protein